VATTQVVEKEAAINEEARIAIEKREANEVATKDVEEEQ